MITVWKLLPLLPAPILKLFGHKASSEIICSCLCVRYHQEHGPRCSRMILSIDRLVMIIRL